MFLATFTACDKPADKDAMADLKQSAAQGAKRVGDAAINVAEKAKEAAPGAVEQAKKYYALAEAEAARIAKKTTLDDEAKEFIERTLGDSRDWVQVTAIPVIKAAAKDPAAREFLAAQLRARVGQAAGGAKKAWENLLKEVESNRKP